MTRLSLFTTHPIQYQVPWFRALHARDEVDLCVYFHHLPSPEQQGEGFGHAFEWDLPLLDGYAWRVYRGAPSLADELRFSSIPQAVSAETSDVVLVAGWQSTYMRKVAVAASLGNCPVLVRGETSALKPRSLSVRAMHWLYVRLFDHFLAIGEANALFYRDRGISEDRIHPCRYFVENERFDRDYQRLIDKRSHLRTEFSVPAGATCVLFVGKFIPKKNPLRVLEALRMARTEDANVHALMVGDGPLLDKARSYAHDHDLPVTFTGFLNQTEIGRAYTAADVLALPSDYDETWGLVVNEGMVFGLPAIVSDRVGCGPDLVADGETGYVFPYGDREALADAIRRVAASDKTRQEMGKRARRQVLNEYTVEAAVEGTLKAIDASRSTDHVRFGR
jgi:glycosyltransferase involved in cell wall biosynthesis